MIDDALTVIFHHSPEEYNNAKLLTSPVLDTLPPSLNRVENTACLPATTFRAGWHEE